MTVPYDGYALESELARAEALWEVVYSRLSSAFADIDAGRFTVEEMKEGKVTPETDEVSILREAAYEIVQAALVALGKS